MYDSSITGVSSLVEFSLLICYSISLRVSYFRIQGGSGRPTTEHGNSEQERQTPTTIRDFVLGLQCKPTPAGNKAGVDE